jgi:PAS domain S-box-containing protein
MIMMKNSLFIFTFLFLSFNCSTQSFSEQKVTLQLRWDHQFQFAGYYAAKWMGYYKEVGLDVDIRSAVQKDNKILSAIKEVVERRANFGIGSADILLAIDKGADLSILSSIFQQSASRFYYIKGKTQINSLADLTSLRVARRKNDLIDIEFQAMLKTEGVDPSLVTPYKYLTGDDHFIKGNVDILPGYNISVPYIEKTKGVKLKSIRPFDYGINFYGDSVFSNRDYVIENLKLVKKFIDASLKGWKYALKNPDKIAGRISKELVRTAPVNDFLSFNSFQIKGVRDLTLYPIVELGHINPHRWNHMANILKKLGLLERLPDIDKIIFDFKKIEHNIDNKKLKILYGTLLAVLVVTLLILIWVKILRNSIAFTNKELKDGISKLERSETVYRESEARFRRLVEKSPLPMVVSDHNQDIIFFSEKFTELFGYTLDDVSTAEKWWSTAYPDEEYRQIVKQSWMDAIEKAELNKTDIEMQEWDLTIKDRSVRRCEFYMVPLGDVSLIVMKDRTEQKKMSDALEESEKKFKGMFENAPLSYQSLDETGCFTDANETWLNTMGYERSEVIGRNFSDFLIPGWQGHFVENFPRFKAVGEVLGVEFEMVKKDGSVILVSFHGKIDKDINGNFERTHCVFHDITRQKSAEDILKKELELNKAIAEISTELLSETYDIKKVSNATLKYVLKLTNSDHGFVSSIDKGNQDHIRHIQSDMFDEDGIAVDKDISFPIGKDGSYPFLWGHGLNTRKSFFTNDPKNHPKFKGIPKGHKNIQNFLSVPVLMGDSLLGLIAVANSKDGYTDQDIVSIKRISEVYALAIYRQEHEADRDKMEKNVRQLQKNEAIGMLASGIAHDFNNILFPIVGFAEILEEDLPENSPMLECVDEILKGALRAKDLVKQILAFSREVEQVAKPVNPYNIVREVTKLIRATIPSTIEIKENLDSDCRMIMADPTQLHQIAMNLITNAYHSMEVSGGILTVALQNTTVTGPEFLDVEPGNYVLFSIKDTGTGIDKATISKIFDPYFSTKDKDKGTGLGLSVVNGIVKNYGGEIKVESSPGKGSLFEVFIPAIDGSVNPGKTIEREEIPKGIEKILLVDDELPILNIEKRSLKRLGYDVDATDSSDDALKKIISSPDKYDLIITDMTMPKLTGINLVKEVRGNNIMTPIIICTGFSGKLTLEKVIAFGANALLSKPVKLSELAQTIREVLKQ